MRRRYEGKNGAEDVAGQSRVEEEAERIAMQQRIQTVMDYLRFAHDLADVAAKDEMVATVKKIDFAFQRHLAKEIKIFIAQQQTVFSANFFVAQEDRAAVANEFLALCDQQAIEVADSWLSTPWKLQLYADEERAMEQRIQSVMSYVKTEKKFSNQAKKQAIEETAKQITFPYQRKLAKALIEFIDDKLEATAVGYVMSWFSENPAERTAIATQFLDKCHPGAIVSARVWLAAEQQVPPAFPIKVI